ncbi:TIGR02466 family protein [Sphingomonas mesophila]|uniref:TIGR02466 family protein n=1 Tax=Sphingomonas mesophila TaxID=2303576 RepID=UPI000E582041|nr:TIGR02466 family protein [Sphingomonas mesophila]
MKQLFVTPLFEARLADPALLGALAHSIRTLAADESAGRRWSRDHGYKGYTSYASLDDLDRRDPAFAELKRLLTRHAAEFARSLAWSVRPRLDSLWVNLIKGDGHHSAHIHPHSILSGTLYVETPPGSGPIRFEDPRLPMMMAAPQRAPDAPEELRQFVDITPEPGLLLLWESWLRHEVRPGRARGERLGVSFNFA